MPQLVALPTALCAAVAPALRHLSSSPLDLPPAELDPPALQSIQSVPFQSDCVTVAWEVARSHAHMELLCELRYRAPEDAAWALVSDTGQRDLGGRVGAGTLRLELCRVSHLPSTPGAAPGVFWSLQPPLSCQVTGIPGQARTTQHCGFLFGTPYCFQMRCRRSSAQGYWSDWSPGRNYTTHEKGGCGGTMGSRLPRQAAQPRWHSHAGPSQLSVPLQPPQGRWMCGGALGQPGRAGSWRCSCAGR